MMLIKKVEVEPVYIEVNAQVRYWEDAKVGGREDKEGALAPFRKGALWCPVIRLADGMVMDWPLGVVAVIHYKVCDQGQYWLLDADRKRIARWKGYYVPDDFLCHGPQAPGYGDYIILDVKEDGSVNDWKIPAIDPDEWKSVCE